MHNVNFVELQRKPITLKCSYQINIKQEKQTLFIYNFSSIMQLFISPFTLPFAINIIVDLLTENYM
jgi:hypothetical protein